MTDQIDSVLRNVVRKYFKKLSVLVSQIPFELRRLLLPPYMLYNGFKSYIHVDTSGRVGFELYRERGSRISVKTREAKNRVEQEIFGVFEQVSMFRFSGINTELRGGVLTCKDFIEKYRDKLPKGASTLVFSKCAHASPIEIGEEAEAKIINCGIYWMLGNKRFIKTVPFAWLFGNFGYLNNLDSLLHAESDFYSSLFGRLYEIVTRGYEERVDEKTQSKVFDLYRRLIERVENELKNQVVVTQADEYVFQQLLARYKFFLYLGALLIENQPALRRKVLRKPDFHIQASKNEHIYVEIEPPFYKPFQDSKPSGRLEGALRQISEWKEILKKQIAKEGSIRYMIIIGLLDDLSKEEKETLQAFNKAQKDLTVVTWDWILENVDRMKQEVMNRLSRQKLSMS